MNQTAKFAKDPKYVRRVIVPFLADLAVQIVRRSSLLAIGSSLLAKPSNVGPAPIIS
jgi:hypothetical protein